MFPYTVGGTIILGLMVSSIHKFARELSKEKVIKQHVETRRVDTLRRAITFEQPVASITRGPTDMHSKISRPLESAQIQNNLDEEMKRSNINDRTIEFHTPDREDTNNTTTSSDCKQGREHRTSRPNTLSRTTTLEKVANLRRRIPALIPTRTQKAILMKNEKDRFDRMRDIQLAAKNFKKWYALVMSIISFGLLWCVGAVVFWIAEAKTQGLSYFQALYFCYVSLLTIVSICKLSCASDSC